MRTKIYSEQEVYVTIETETGKRNFRRAGRHVEEEFQGIYKTTCEELHNLGTPLYCGEGDLLNVIRREWRKLRNRERIEREREAARW